MPLDEDVLGSPAWPPAEEEEPAEAIYGWTPSKWEEYLKSARPLHEAKLKREKIEKVKGEREAQKQKEAARKKGLEEYEIRKLAREVQLRQAKDHWAEEEAEANPLGPNVAPGVVARAEEYGAEAVNLPHGAMREEDYLAVQQGEARQKLLGIPGEKYQEKTPEEEEAEHVYDYEPADPFHGLDAKDPARFEYSQVLQGKHSGKAGAVFFMPVEGMKNVKASRAMKLMQDAWWAENGEGDEDNQLFLTSANRTDEMQKKFHPEWSKEKRDRSTHRLGHGFDINLDRMGKNSPKYKWLEKNAERFGFKWPGYKYTDKATGKSVTEWHHWEFIGKSKGTDEISAKVDAATKAPAEVNSPQSFLDYAQSELARARAETGSEQEGLKAYARAIKDTRAPMQAAASKYAGHTEALEASKLELEQSLAGVKEEYANTKEVNAQMEKELGERETKYFDQQSKLGRQLAKERLETADELIEGLTGEIDPWRKWGFHDEEGEFQVSNMLRTIVGVPLLIANFLITMGTAAQKGSSTVPFMVWNMIESSIKTDVKAQVDALSGRSAAINKLHTSAGKWRQWTDDNILHQKALHKHAMQDGLNELKVLKAKEDNANTKWAIGEVINIMGKKAATADLAFRQKNHEVSMKGAKAQLEIHKAGKSEEYGAAQLVLQGYGLIAAKKKADAKNKGIPVAFQDIFLSAKAFKHTLREVRQLWTDHGKDWNLLSKGLADKDWLNKWPEMLKGDSLKAMQRLNNIRETSAANLHKLSGDVGPIAVREQIMAMGRLPLKDDYQLGFWKIRRLEAFLNMLTNPAFYQLSLDQRGKLIEQTLGRTEQQNADLINLFNDQSGHTRRQGPLPSLAGKKIQVGDKTFSVVKPGTLK